MLAEVSSLLPEKCLAPPSGSGDHARPAPGRRAGAACRTGPARAGAAAGDDRHRISRARRASHPDGGEPRTVCRSRHDEGVDAAAIDDAVGRIAGTEDATPLEFRVAVRPEAYLQLDDVVVTPREVPGVGAVTIAGVVTEVTRPARGRAVRLRRVPDRRRRAAGPGAGGRRDHHHPGRAGVYVPPQPGAVGPPGERTSSGTGRCTSTGWSARCRSGIGRDGAPIYVNLDFLDGTRGAHVSISGISGVATKTSFALFLLHSLFRSGVLGGRRHQRQGAGLLGQGRGPAVPGPRRTPGWTTATRARSTRGSGCRPSRSGRSAFFAPPRPGDLTGRPDVTGRTDGVDAFWWTLAEFCAAASCCRTCSPTPRTSATSTRWWCTRSPPGCAPRARRPAPTAAVSVDGTLLRHLRRPGRLHRGPAHRRGHPAASGPARRSALGTVNAFVRRLRSSLKPIWPADPRPTCRAPAQHGDLHRAPAGHRRRPAQPAGSRRSGSWSAWCCARRPSARRRPGRASAAVHDDRRAEQVRAAGGLLARSRSVLLDIAERGRSLGIILIGAQQTAREVERRIVSNSRDQGRRPARPGRGRPPRVRLPAGQPAAARATLAKPGTMFVSQPEIPVPLAVEFPFPAWATRQTERGRRRRPRSDWSATDPFDRGCRADDDPPPF